MRGNAVARFFGVFIFVIQIAMVGCGGNGDSGGGGGSAAVTGGTFTSSNGLATITVPAGVIPSELGVTNPTLSALTQLPAEIIINSANGELNVTKDVVGYEFNLTGSDSVGTTPDKSFNFRFAFTPVESAGMIVDGVKYLVRILDRSTSLLVDVNGTISTDSKGQHFIDVDSTFLPKQFDATIVYQPGRILLSIQGDTSGLMAQNAASSPPWSNDGWCVHVDLNSQNVISATEQLLNITSPTSENKKYAIKELVGSRLNNIQNIYKTNGFGGPSLFPPEYCDTTTMKYSVYLQDRQNSSDRPGWYKYGKIFILTEILDKSHWNSGDLSLTSILAHELFHAVTTSYYPAGFVPKGFEGIGEGSATIIGRTVDVNNEITGSITVRSLPLPRHDIENMELKLLDPSDDTRYTYQDFFAFVAKKHNKFSLGYFKGLFINVLNSADTQFSSRNYPLEKIYGKINSYFSGTFNHSLDDIYIDFVLQRSIMHDDYSQLRGLNYEQSKSGFARLNMFPNLATISINPNQYNAPQTWSKTVEKFSARALVIEPSIVRTAAVKNRLIVNRKTFYNSMHVYYWSGAGDPIEITDTYNMPPIVNFGNNGDKLILLLINTDYNGDNTKDNIGIEYSIEIDGTEPACQDVSGSWLVNDSATITCSGSFGSGTQTQHGSGYVTITQNGCNISFMSPANTTRSGTVTNYNIQFSGILAQTSGAVITQNYINFNGTISQNLKMINTTGTGAVTGSVSGVPGSCTASSIETFTR